MPDTDINCVQCGAQFLLTEAEQSFFQQRKMALPKRCKPCRAAANADTGGRVRYEITCGKCGKQDRVPFKPVAGRAVLCSECFGAARARHA